MIPRQTQQETVLEKLYKKYVVGSTKSLKHTVYFVLLKLLNTLTLSYHFKICY